MIQEYQKDGKVFFKVRVSVRGGGGRDIRAASPAIISLPALSCSQPVLKSIPFEIISACSDRNKKSPTILRQWHTQEVVASCPKDVNNGEATTSLWPARKDFLPRF